MEDTEVKPHYERHTNPAYSGGEGFTHFEIEAEYEIGGEDQQYAAVAEDTPADVTVEYAVYGRSSWGSSELITRYPSLWSAKRLLKMLGVPIAL